ncbi:MAG: hypothetical protein ACK4NN_11730, partial [Rheinheimera sp.]
TDTSPIDEKARVAGFFILKLFYYKALVLGCIHQVNKKLLDRTANVQTCPTGFASFTKTSLSPFT